MTTKQLFAAQFSQDQFVVNAIRRSTEFKTIAEKQFDTPYVNDVALLANENGEAVYVVQRNSDAGNYEAYQFDTPEDAGKYYVEISADA